MVDYDPMRAIQQELEGLNQVSVSMRRRQSVAEEAIAKAENELNDINKVYGFLKIEIERKRTILSELQEKAKAETR
jgi:hypothetical protein